MSDTLLNDRTAAIERFAQVLIEVRSTAGEPSFRAMAGKSGAISHTTLHEAVQGSRLPSWPTTIEFVRACGQEPAQVRHEWEAANAAVRGRRQPAVSGAVSVESTRPAEARPNSIAKGRADEPTPDATDLPPGAPPPAPAPARDPEPPHRRTHMWTLIAGLVGGVVLAVIGLSLWLPAASGHSAAETATASGGCPIRQPNPAPAAPLHPGDHATFIADVTAPDCSTVKAGSTFVKTWRFRNAGTVAWNGYALHRVDGPQTRNDCQTISDVEVPRTAPGGTVDIKTEVTAPERAGFCFVRFRLYDGAGRLAFPGGKPVYFQVFVK